MFQGSEKAFVVLSRKIMTWQWYTEPCTKDLFIHCILRANWKAGEWKGQHYERGQFITSLPSLASELGYSVRNIRTAISHLKATGEITDRSTNKYRIITVVNYNKYQDYDRPSDRQVTGNRQTSDRQVTGNRQTSDRQVTADKQYNNINNNNNNKDIYNVSFESLWEVYPRKVDKASAYKQYKARLEAGFTDTELFHAVSQYAQECEAEKRDMKYIKHCKTFLGPSTPFVDYLTKEQKDDGEDKQGRPASDYYKRYLTAGNGDRD